MLKMAKLDGGTAYDLFLGRLSDPKQVWLKNSEETPVIGGSRPESYGLNAVLHWFPAGIHSSVHARQALRKTADERCALYTIKAVRSGPAGQQAYLLI